MTVLRPAPIDKPLCTHDRVVDERAHCDPYTKQSCIECGRVAYLDDEGRVVHVDWPHNPLKLVGGWGPA